VYAVNDGQIENYLKTEMNVTKSDVESINRIILWRNFNVLIVLNFLEITMLSEKNNHCQFIYQFNSVITSPIIKIFPNKENAEKKKRKWRNVIFCVWELSKALCFFIHKQHV
jgi:hypothetical protein